MMPLAILLAWTVLRWLRWYGIATCARTGWGTRQNGAEVSLKGNATAAPAVSAPSPQPPPAAAVPVAKLLDPCSERTLEIARPRR
jgi:hyaluronan synthase